MIPPPSFKREANTKLNPPLSTIQKIVRYAEKDDLLLYITAAFGILMPAAIYFFYRTIHSKYHKYQEYKRKIEKINRRTAKAKEPRTISIFYSPDKSIKKVAYALAEELDNFDPVVKKLLSSEVAASNLSAKCVLIMLVEDSGSNTLSEFLDWLDELRYEYRQRSYMRGASFLVIGFKRMTPENKKDAINGSEDEDKRMVEVLHKRLQSLQGRPIEAPKIFEETVEGSIDKHELNELSISLCAFLKQFQFGAFDEPAQDEESMSTESEYEENETADEGRESS